jgi:hypothetical protein
MTKFNPFRFVYKRIVNLITRELQYRRRLREVRDEDPYIYK